MISACSGAIGKFREKSLSINPQKTHLFTFDIHAYNTKGGSYYCVGKLSRSIRHLYPPAGNAFVSAINVLQLLSSSLTSSAAVSGLLVSYVLG